MCTCIRASRPNTSPEYCRSSTRYPPAKRTFPGAEATTGEGIILYTCGQLAAIVYSTRIIDHLFLVPGRFLKESGSSVFLSSICLLVRSARARDVFSMYGFSCRLKFYTQFQYSRLDMMPSSAHSASSIQQVQYVAKEDTTYVVNPSGSIIFHQQGLCLSETGAVSLGRARWIRCKERPTRPKYEHADAATKIFRDFSKISVVFSGRQPKSSRMIRSTNSRFFQLLSSFTRPSFPPQSPILTPSGLFSTTISPELDDPRHKIICF